MQAGDFESDTCMDISGENVASGTGLIGYTCTGRWNQLFRFTNYSTIQALQPSFISRARGVNDGQDVWLCLEALKTNFLVAASCKKDTDDDIKNHQHPQHFQLMWLH